MTFTLTTQQEIIDKCGVNADTDLTTSQALLSRYCAQAEGKVCAVSRYDWLNNLPTTSFALSLLSDVTSDLVAMKVIKDSMGSYFSKAEALTMLNVLNDNVTSNLSLLKDSDVRAKMGVTS